MAKIAITWRSRNAKTGPMPTTMSQSKTCPDTCPFKGAGCYAELGHTARHWRKLDKGETGFDRDHFPNIIRAIEPGQIWRHNVAGDLQGDGETLNADHLAQITKANEGRQGFTYTHYDPANPVNRRAIAKANAGGFTVNLSGNSPADADRLADTGAGPVVTVLPADTQKQPQEGLRAYRQRVDTLTTPAGRRIVVCPATYLPDVNCKRCKLCAMQRDAVIGFPAHGQRKRTVSKIVQEYAGKVGA